MPGDLTADPTFQLNLVLWMLQPLPPGIGAPVPRPVLRDVGYSVRSIGAELVAEGDLERRLAEVDLRGVPRPDVIAAGPAAARWPVIECKASSFGPGDSRPASQARKILVRASDVSKAVFAEEGQVTSGAAVWLTRTDHADEVTTTLAALTQELEAKDLPTAPSGVIGVRLSPKGVEVAASGGDLPTPMREELTEPLIVLPRADEDEQSPRPLYFIPFDPGVDQEEDERSRCIAILEQRGRMHAASMLGRATTPSTVVLDGLALLRQATFGVSDQWREVKDRAKAAGLILDRVAAALASMKDAPRVTRRGGAHPTLEVLIEDDAAAAHCANELAGAEPVHVDRIPFEQLGLDLDGG